VSRSKGRDTLAHDSRMRSVSGFTLLEFMIVVGVMVMLASLLFIDLSRNARTRSINSAEAQVAALLERARSNALVGQDNRNWGVYFNNSTDDTFEYFSTPVDYADPGKSTKEVIFLIGEITFADPTEGNTTEVVFSAGAGTTTAASIQLANGQEIRTISISTEGRIE